MTSPFDKGDTEAGCEPGGLTFFADLTFLQILHIVIDRRELRGDGNAGKATETVYMEDGNTYTV